MAYFFFQKNVIDLDVGAGVVITPTDSVASDPGTSAVDLMRNRDNNSGWGTTGSSDAGGTKLEIAFPDQYDFDSIFLLGNNWKNYTLKYYDSSGVLQTFATPIAPSANAETNQFHSVTAVAGATGFQAIINGTMVANDDKVLAQLVLCKKIGQLVAQPIIQSPIIGKNKRELLMVSGKKKIQQSSGAIEQTLYQNNVTSDADLSLVETLHSYLNGFLVWPCGNDATQFGMTRIGYRRQDLYFVNIASELTPEWESGIYGYGIPINFRMVEVNN